jgi:bifunctional non-homologous end joining protein LigD
LNREAAEQSDVRFGSLAVVRALLERKECLAQLLVGVPHIHYVEHLEAHGEALFAKVCELDFEGIVAKRADSPYRAGRRSSWLKIKNQKVKQGASMSYPMPWRRPIASAPLRRCPGP